MTGDAEKIINLWREMVGDPNYIEEDLSDVWPVQLGNATEALQIEWYARKRGLVSRIGEVVIGSLPWMAATLDAWDLTRDCPIECKHVGGFEPSEVIVARYAPQTTWQMLVTGAKECALSVIMGAKEPTVDYLPLDKRYADELMKRAEQFMACVRSLTPPVPLPAVASPVIPRKIYPMDGNADWKAQADRWIQSHGAAEIAKEAEKALKAMVPADAVKCAGNGVTISLDRAGRLSLRKG